MSVRLPLSEPPGDVANIYYSWNPETSSRIYERDDVFLKMMDFRRRAEARTELRRLSVLPSGGASSCISQSGCPFSAVSQAKRCICCVHIENESNIALLLR